MKLSSAEFAKTVVNWLSTNRVRKISIFFSAAVAVEVAASRVTSL